MQIASFIINRQIYLFSIGLVKFGAPEFGAFDGFAFFGFLVSFLAPLSLDISPPLNFCKLHFYFINNNTILLICKLFFYSFTSINLR